MTETTIKNPTNVQRRAGRNIRKTDEAVLRQVERYFGDRGVTVLGALFAREPGLMNFYATAYTSLKPGDEKWFPPFGVIRVSFLRNGTVRCRVMGLETTHGEYHGDTKIEWR